VIFRDSVAGFERDESFFLEKGACSSRTGGARWRLEHRSSPAGVDGSGPPSGAHPGALGASLSARSVEAVWAGVYRARDWGALRGRCVARRRREPHGARERAARGSAAGCALGASLIAPFLDAVWVGVGWATYWGALHAVAASLMEHGGGRAVKTISGRPGEGSRTRAGRVVERVLYRVRGCAANRCKAVEPCAHYGRGGATILRCNTR